MVGTPNSSFSLQSNNYPRVQQHETFNDEAYRNNLSLTKARMTNPDSLNPVITHLMGKESKKFPMLFLTEGQKGGVKYVEIEDVEYDWPVFGRLRRSDAIVGHEYKAGDQPGYGGAVVYVTFKTAWLKYQHNVTSPNGTQARIISRPEKVSNGFRYALDIIRNNNSVYIHLDELKPNTVWSMYGGANVSESHSTGNESNVQMPGKLKNQIGVLRKSYEVGGNISQRTMTFHFGKGEGGGYKNNYYLPFEEWQHELNFKQDCEESIWESRYNRDVNGVVMNIDPDTQLPIPYGAGIKEQIPNRDTYGILSLRKINQIISDITYGATDADFLNIVLFTGMKGKEEFSNAIMRDASGWSLYDGALKNTITGDPRGLVFGAYFTGFRHIDGHMVTVAHLPYLDYAIDNAPLHPISLKPLSSYEMHFVDMTVYDGENNVQLVSQKGRSLIRGIEQGMTLLKGLNYGDYSGNQMDIKLATNQDKTSIHYLKTLGAAIRRNTHCFSLYCNI